MKFSSTSSPVSGVFNCKCASATTNKAVIATACGVPSLRCNKPSRMLSARSMFLRKFQLRFEQSLGLALYQISRAQCIQGFTRVRQIRFRQVELDQANLRTRAELF